MSAPEPITCPKCGSADCRKFSVAYEQGTSTGKSTSLDVDVTNNSQTTLAKRCSPPREPEIGCFLILIGIVLAIFVALKIGYLVGSFWVGVSAFLGLLIALNVLWHFTLGAPKKKQFALDLAAWNTRWVCLKCGNDFRSV